MSDQHTVATATTLKPLASPTCSTNPHNHEGGGVCSMWPITDMTMQEHSCTLFVEAAVVRTRDTSPSKQSDAAVLLCWRWMSRWCICLLHELWLADSSAWNSLVMVVVAASWTTGGRQNEPELPRTDWWMLSTPRRTKQHWSPHEVDQGLMFLNRCWVSSYKQQARF